MQTLSNGRDLQYATELLGKTKCNSPVCLVYKSEDEKSQWVRLMTRVRSNQNELVIPFIALLSEQNGRNCLGIDEFLELGPSLQSSIRLAADGAFSFSPRRTLEEIARLVERKPEPCFFILDLSLAAAASSKGDAFLTFANDVHELIRDKGASSMCMYAARTVSAEQVLTLLKRHRIFCSGDKLWLTPCPEELGMRGGEEQSDSPAVEAVERAADACNCCKQPLDTSWQGLASGIMRDFNTLFMLAMNHAKDIEQAARHEPAVTTDTRRILALMQRGKDLAQQISEFAFPDGERQPRSSIHRVLTALTDATAPLLPDGVSLCIDVEENLPPFAIDLMQFEQAVFNLIMNAREAVEGSGEIKIFAESVDTTRPEGADMAPLPQDLPEGVYVRIRVEDNGRGMPEGVRKHACEPLFTTKQNVESAGLGLAVVHRIVTANGGYVYIASTPGKGTRFDMWFPAVAMEPPSRPQTLDDDAK